MMTLINQSTVFFDEKDLLHTDEETSDRLRDDNGNSFNFNRDIDKLCFKNALTRFLLSGTKEDAYDIYFCFNEIFQLLGEKSEGINTLLSLLYQHEANAASLLMKHRDHYSHSVYVFALGLAIFCNNKKMRDAFSGIYGVDKLYDKFLKYWGICSLFHDIGYPYEISFNQVLDYGKKIDGDVSSDFLSLAYSNFDNFVRLTDEEKTKCRLFGEGINDLDINTLFAKYVCDNFGAIGNSPQEDLETVSQCLKSRIVKPSKFMDHAFFSAVILIKKLLSTPQFVLDKPAMDSIAAILLHNSFYKRTYKDEIRRNVGYKQISLSSHPLAYLLMLCDELQCWDRMPYGENTKLQNYPWDMDITVGDRSIRCVYYYSSQPDEKTALKQCTLAEQINESVVDTSELASLNVQVKEKSKTKCVYKYLSDSKFIDLQKMASAINASYTEDCNADNIENMNKEYAELSLEYKLSNIAQAKHYIQHIENIGCFFSDKQLDLTPVTDFSEDEKEYLARCEHIRWANEKVAMGWRYGTYSNRAERERKRLHKDLVPYDYLNYGEQKKDWYVIDNMVKQLDKFGIKIYRTSNNLPPYTVGCVGHRDLSRIEGFDETAVRKKIRLHLKSLAQDYKVTMYNGFARGADLLFAEEAYNCGIDVIAVLPIPWNEFIAEHENNGVKFMQLLAQTKQVIVRPHIVAKYKEVSRYISSKADEMLVLWDGKDKDGKDEKGNHVNIGGTFDTVRRLANTDMKILHFGKSRTL